MNTMTASLAGGAKIIQPYYDNPITSVADDEFSRADLARRCASVLKSINSKSSYVVGLSGPWGSGKTSFVNMVKEIILSDDSNQVVINFDAWLYSSQEQLVAQFFSELRRAIDGHKNFLDEATNELGELISEYAETIASGSIVAASAFIPPLTVINAAIPYASQLETFVIKRVLSKAGEALQGKEKTVEQLRGEISEKLAKLEDNIIVIIDDVDRLPKEEICALFKLVNLTAAFPHMTFLLSYDQMVVANALGDIQGMDGSDYLDKIVQTPINLPPALQDLLRKQLEEVIVPYLNSLNTYRIDESERNRFLNAFDAFVMSMVDTPRQVKRYQNMFEIVTAGVVEEVCPTDVVAMTGIQLFFPHAFRWLYENRYNICTSDRFSLPVKDNYLQMLCSSLDDAIGIDCRDIEGLRNALELLFPKIKCLSNANYTTSMSVKRETGRVANIANFELYYGVVGEASLKVDRVQLYHLTFDANPEDLEECILKLDVLGDLLRLIESVDVNRREISPERKELLCQQFFDVIGRLRQDERPSLFQRTPNEKTAIMLHDLLCDLGVSVADEIVTEAVKNFKGIDDYVGFSWFLRKELSARNDEGEVKCCLSPDSFICLGNAYIEAIIKEYPYVLRMEDHPAKFLWRHIDESIGGSALSRIRSCYGEDVTVRVLCGAAGLAHWVGGSSDGYGYGPSSEEGYEPVFPEPNAAEIESVAKSTEFAVLPVSLRLRVASLYILVTGVVDEDNYFNKGEVTAKMAASLLDSWANGSG